MISLLRIKKISSYKEMSKARTLKKTLSAMDIFLLGIGVIVGTGIFVMTGIGASNYAGPAITISFLIAGVTCIFVALCYTEIATMLPESSSVYTYCYVAIGEIGAWLVGWILLMGLTVDGAAVAAGWSGYFCVALQSIGIHLPQSLTSTPFDGGIINLPAIIITLLLTTLLVRGTKESAKLNNFLVVIKIATIMVFLSLAAGSFKKELWNDFAPFGVSGVLGGAAFIFFAFTGFDLLSTAAEECKNPKKDFTIGLIGSLVFCTLLYIAIAAFLTGMVPYSELGNAHPLAFALQKNGSNIGSALVAVGAITGMTTVLLVNTFAQSRLMYFIARDGLLPNWLNNLHKRYQTPYLATIISGLTVALVSGFFSIHVIGAIASTGTLIGFIVVSLVVLILRVKEPDIERPFKCPIVYIIAPISMLSCSYLLYELLSPLSILFVIWGVIGLLIYVAYGYKASKMNNI
jgi:APA family basic amino acid/polyamine antiporter